MKKIGVWLWSLFEKTVRAVVGFFLKLFRIQLSEEQWEKFMQFVKYCLVGCSNVLVSFVTYAIALFIIDSTGWSGMVGSIENCDVHLATFIAFFANVFNSYFWNQKFVFHSSTEYSAKQHVKAFIKVLCTYSVTHVFLSWGLNVLWLSVFGLPKLLANPLNQIVCLPLNFLLNKFWSFKE